MLSRKVILTAFAIGLTCLLIFGIFGSMAWFTSSVNTKGSISSGNFDLKVTSGPLDLTKLEPGAGYRQIGEFCLLNNGDYDMKLRVRVKNVEDPGGLKDFLKLKLVLKALNNEDQNYYGGVDDLILFSDMPFTALMDWNDKARLLFDKQGAVDPFFPNMKSCYKLFANLSEDASSNQISKSLKFDLFFNATQLINPGW
jgi:predicted ribosomally synthesized peptide with SipW-like signal peptide